MEREIFKEDVTLNISELLKEVETKGQYVEKEVLDITDNSKEVSAGSVFVCIKGARFDGHSVAVEMEEKGAVLLVAEHPTGAKNEVLVKDTRRAYAMLCAAFYGYPAKQLKLIGVTGTNGKTTTTILLKSLFDKAGYKTGLIGTVENRVDKTVYPAAYTTPDSKQLQFLFRQMVDAGCTHCVMEVSSQALVQGRVEGCHFALALFTNLTQDHLDYHGNFENYAAAKRILFTQCDTAILNTDDPYAMEMTKGLSVPTVTYSVHQNDSNYTAKNVICTASHVQYELLGNGNIGRVRVNIPGRFTVYNSLGAAVCALLSGLDFDKTVSLLSEVQGVKGRIEVVPTDTEYTVLIDYAHSPDGLTNILTSLREIAKKRIITVFGCGGDRDKTKRPIMGATVGALSDVAVVTSDNPRTENPDAIIEDVLAGMEKCKAKVKRITDRTEAIRYALSIAETDDIVLLAGKGHETYQIRGTEKFHYDEREIVNELLKG